LNSRLIFILFTLFLCLSCDEKNEDLRFVLNEESGIDFSNSITTTPQLNILNYLYFYNGAGVTLTDFNNDGLLDVYFTSNQEADQLYINQGNLSFINRTKEAGINNADGWTFGVTTVDINADGLMDIYISKVSGHLDLKGHNLLYINQGIQDGIPHFTEESKKYGLNYSGLSTQASFFDYDLDGDLDMYMMNHSLYPNKKFGRGSLRNKVDTLYGDRLFKNDHGTFIDVTSEAGILQNTISFGLGLATSDINNDGYPDIYIGNDFFEDDYLYINQQDGTFKELNTTEGVLGHSTHFSMGNDVADLTNDGLPEIVSVDMLPQDLATLKTAGTEYSYPIFQNNLRGGYQPQYMQNTLHHNLGQNKYSETAFLNQIAATEWSWAPLLADFDNDGYKDIFITNGILGATNDLDFVNFIANEEIQKRLGSGMQEEDLQFIEQLPQKKTANYLFKNNQDAPFTNTSKTWLASTTSFSHGAAYGDLDNDGDLDLVVNNTNQKAYVLENQTRKIDSTTNYLQLKFKGADKNTFGIGAKVHVYYNGKQQSFENQTTRGYLSAVPPSIFVGLEKQVQEIDSLHVIWPGGAYQSVRSMSASQTLVLDASNAAGNYYQRLPSKPTGFMKEVSTPISFRHKDGISLEFSRDPLIPYATTNLGPEIIAGDLNGDGLEDLVTLGAKGQSTKWWMQLEDGSFQEMLLPDAKETSINEDTAALIFDANGDGANDLLIGSGGNEFKSGKPLQLRLYLQSPNGLVSQIDPFKSLAINVSSLSTVDLDNDGDLDISVNSNVVPHFFGKTPTQYLFVNNGNGDFTNRTESWSKEYQQLGNVTQTQWIDLDGNGFKDAIVVGHWMPVSVFMNNGKVLQAKRDIGLENTHGWWNTLQVADFDKDGDLDLLAGNFGLNTRLQPTVNKPITLYCSDFDGNGKIEPLVTYFHEGAETPIATKDELVKQLPQLNKKFLSYDAFAKASMNELFGSDQLKNAATKKVFQLATMYFVNDGTNHFKAQNLPHSVQVSSTHDIQVSDFNNDGYLDALLVGNFYEISTQLGRLDGSHGVLLLNNKTGSFDVVKNTGFQLVGACRSIDEITILDKKQFVVGRNNDTPLFLVKEE